QIALGTFTTASGSDFVARFPAGATILPGQYVVVSLGNASGGSASFEATYGAKPDFELRPSADGASDDPSVPNMQPAQSGASIGAQARSSEKNSPVETVSPDTTRRVKTRRKRSRSLRYPPIERPAVRRPKAFAGPELARLPMPRPGQ